MLGPVLGTPQSDKGYMLVQLLLLFHSRKKYITSIISPFPFKAEKEERQGRYKERMKGTNIYHLCFRCVLHKLFYLIFSIILCCEKILVMWKLRLKKGVDPNHTAGKRTEFSVAVTPDPCTSKLLLPIAPWQQCTDWWRYDCTGRCPVAISLVSILLSFCPSICSGHTPTLRVHFIRRRHSVIEGAIRKGHNSATSAPPRPHCD